MRLEDDLLAREISARTRLPFSTIVRIWLGTPMDINDTVFEVRKRYQARKEAVRGAQLRK